MNLLTKVVLSLIAVTALLGGVLFYIISAAGVQAGSALAGPVACVATLATGGQAGNTPLDQEQRDIAGTIIATGKQRGLAPRAWQIAIQAGKTESQLHNAKHGDRDSLGIFQMRPSMGWGSEQQVTNAVYAINKFYDVLLGVPGWESLRPGQAAQLVERSGFPERYDQVEQFAVTVVRDLAGVTVADLTGCQNPEGAAGNNLYAEQAMLFARDQRGKRYVWGAAGPDTYDCSGLVLAAYRSAGLALPRASIDQYNAGKHVPVSEAQPGDLIFWGDAKGNPEAIHHVALYLGNGQVIQAPQDGDTVKISQLWQNGLVQTATRPGTGT